MVSPLFSQPVSTSLVTPLSIVEHRQPCTVSTWAVPWLSLPRWKYTVSTSIASVHPATPAGDPLATTRSFCPLAAVIGPQSTSATADFARAVVAGEAVVAREAVVAEGANVAGAEAGLGGGEAVVLLLHAVSASVAPAAMVATKSDRRLSRTTAPKRVDWSTALAVEHRSPTSESAANREFAT